MPIFQTPLRVEYIDGDFWLLITPLVYEVSEGDVITVPGGFKTDFASIPRIFWRILPPQGWGGHDRHGPASVVHDYLYQKQARPKPEADLIFREAMLSLGVSPWRAAAMYWAVRLFGSWAWHSYDKPGPQAVNLAQNQAEIVAKIEAPADAPAGEKMKQVGP